MALVGTFAAARRSLANGLGVCLLCGYVYGVLRSNYLDGFAQFIFDASVLGLYAARLGPRLIPRGSQNLRTLFAWVIALVAWPTFLLLLPYDPFLINLVGLRVAIYFVPVLLVGIQLKGSDVAGLASWLAALNLAALAAAVYEVRYGIESLYPRNAVTYLIYATAIGEESTHRIPSIFPTAAAYGGAMTLSVPFLVFGLNRPLSKPRIILLLGGIGAAGAGLLLCSCRSPVLLSVSGLAFFLLLQGKASLRPKYLLLGAALVPAIGYTMAYGGGRAERFLELADVQELTSRAAHVNELDILGAMVLYPFGNGLAGTTSITIPYFLRDVANNRLVPGVESEYFRIVYTQGIPGVILWAGFLVWFFARPLRAEERPREPSYYYFYALALPCFLLASRGVGLLNGVPGNCLLLLGMGAFLRATVPSPRAAAAPRLGRVNAFPRPRRLSNL